MNQRISFITLGVKNLQIMRTFYTQVFGWTLLKDSDGIVFFKLNGFILGLFPSHELAEDANVSEIGSGFKSFSLSINLNSEKEVDLLFQELISKGARSLKSPERVFWGGYRGYIADPEDNLWELAYNPFLKMDEKGNVVHHP
ncbi:MAG TPA: VOC family protein [Flavobacteriales bacterium]|nr:VOC family protein [Flavobacteriales bacterium]